MQLGVWMGHFWESESDLNLTEFLRSICCIRQVSRGYGAWSISYVGLEHWTQQCMIFLILDLTVLLSKMTSKGKAFLMRD